MNEFHFFEAPPFTFYSTLHLKPKFADFDPKVHYNNHLHNGYELLYFLQGDVDYIVGDSMFHLNSNDLLLIQPAVYHYPKLLSDVPYHRITINFTNEHLIQSIRADIGRFKTYYKIPANNVICDLYKHAVDAVDLYEKSDVQSALIQYLNLILTELKYLDKTPKEQPNNIHPLLSEILNFIDSNLTLPMNLNFLADTFSISPTWLTHFFKQHMNISVMQYIVRKKILTAQHLIENGTPTAVAAEQLGFENYTSFYFHYKNILGKTPSQSKHKG